MTSTRIPHEYAELLDRILSSVPSTQRVYVHSTAPQLIHAASLRHDEIVVDDHHDVEWLRRHSPSLEFVDTVQTDFDHALICEPAGVEPLSELLASFPDDVPSDCIVGNPYSFNRVSDRSLAEWCSPIAVWRELREADYAVSVEGMHGPRSISQSVIGRVWQSLGRLDRRDIRTHRMRAAYRERWLPFALASCFVHLAGRRV